MVMANDPEMESFLNSLGDFDDQALDAAVLLP